MDWRTINFDWNRARAFLVTAEEGSFSAASQALGVSQPTIGRQVTALEEELGVTLFERVGRGLQLTETGQALAEHVQAMGQAATRLSLSASGRSTALEGLVSIAASEAVSVYLLPPVIAELRRRHPGIVVEVVASNQASDLQRGEADIAVRNFRPKEPELVARKIGDSNGWLYATPEYLASAGHPQSAEALSQCSFVGFDRSDALVNAYNNMLGLSVGHADFPIISGSHLAQWAMCVQGLGVCAMMQQVGDPEPRVQRVGCGLQPIVVPTWLTSHRALHTSGRLRVVFDLLAEGLTASLAE